jgi:hypothetical protein
MTERLEHGSEQRLEEPRNGTRARHVVVGLLFAALGCSKPSSGGDSSTKAQGAAVTSASAAPAARSGPQSLHRLELSAYTSTLAADDEGIYVLASQGAYRFIDGEPVARWAIDLGDTPALTDRGFVYWLDGAVRQVPKRGGPSEILARVPRAPRRLSASGKHLVWEEPDEAGSLLRTLDGSAPRTIYRASGPIEAISLMDDQLYFVERSEQQWRLGAVPLSGGVARFSEPHGARAPAQLAATGDLFYYDGPSSSVRRLPSDLSREEVIARDVICSPLAVADRVYCAQLSLLFDFARDGGRVRSLAPKRPGTITALVATRTRVAWLLDVGDNRAELEVLAH